MPTGTVTFLFTDVEGSTRRWESHPNEMRQAMAAHDRILRETIGHHGGSVFTTAGDAFCASFSSPLAALNASIDTQLALAEEEWGVVAPMRVRAALHTGNAEERDGDYFGRPLNRCARLLALGHGGQVLLSATTAHLLADGLPPGVALEDLGSHQLKDMDRPEHVFSVHRDGLLEGHPPLRSENSQSEQLLQLGRAAHDDENWEEAYQALSSAAESGDLTAWDHHKLADAAYWTGRTDETIPLRETSYARLLDEGETEAAAMEALDVAFLYKYRLAGALANAWVRRAEKLLEGQEGTRGHGYLLRWRATYALDVDGDPVAAIAFAEEVIELGRQIDDRSLVALGLMDKGRTMVSMGDIDDGMALVDESMIAAVAGEIDSDATGRNYCNMLSVCDQIADYERASEWSEAAEAWCTNHSDSAYPGICRIYRAELKWLRGDWQDATEDLRRAVEELSGFTPIIGAALYQIGEVELRAGNLDAAEVQFRAAKEHAFPPLPGMATLLLQRGDPDAAEQLLLDALISNPQPLIRAKYIPAMIDIEIALNRTDEAARFLDELEKTAELCDSTAMRAEADDRRGVLALAATDIDVAVDAFSNAIKRWSSLRMPYEAAQSRLQLGDALRQRGNLAGADLETEAANATLLRLSSTP